MLRTSHSLIRRRLVLSVLPFTSLFCSLHLTAQTSKTVVAPPVAPVRSVTDTYFGQQVEDPYRYLEDQKSPEVVALMRGQADYTRAVLDSIPGREAFAADMSRYMNAEEAAITDVRVAGPYLFYRKRKRGENQASLYVRPAAGGAERMLLDVPKLSTATTHVSLDDFSPADDGRFVAVNLSPGGSEIKTAHIYETASGRELPETLERCEGSIFSGDDKALIYLQLEKLGPDAPPTDKYRKPTARQHILRTPVASDTAVLGRGVTGDIDVPEFAFPIAFTVPGSKSAFAVVTPGVDPYSTYYVGPASALTTHRGWKKFASPSDKATDEAVHGDDVYLVSFDGALNGKILRVDAAHPDLKTAEVVLPASDLVLTGGFIGTNVLHAAADALYVECLQKGIGRVLRVPYGSHPKVTTLPLPADEHADAVATALSVPGAIVDLTSWTTPGDDFRYDPKTASVTALHLKAPNTVDPTDLVSEEVTIKGLDGTPLPLSIVYKKGLVKDGSAPTALIGYGAYGDAFTPGFSRRNMAWLGRGAGGGTCAGRWRAWRRLASCRQEADQAEHLAGLYRFGTVPDRCKVHVDGPPGDLEPVGGWNFNWAVYHGAAGPVRGGGGRGAVLGHAAAGDRGQWAGEYPGVWLGEGCGRVQVALPDGSVRPHRSGNEVSGDAGHGGRERPSCGPVAGGEDGVSPAGGQRRAKSDPVSREL